MESLFVTTDLQQKGALLRSLEQDIAEEELSTNLMSKQVEWRPPAPAPNADPGSIFADQRPTTRRTPAAMAYPTIDVERPRRPHEDSRTEPSDLTVRFPDTIKASTLGNFARSPEKWDAHHQSWRHIGGSAGVSAAGVRTQLSPSSKAPWVVQTGKPPGGWSVAGSAAEGW